MQRKQKLYIAKVAVIMSAIPFLIWAHEYGPDVGHSNVPGELGTCNQSTCHVGTAVNAGSGSVSVTFPNGSTYTPGVKQHLVVTIADSAQKAWGFQLTARPADSTATMAGGFAFTDANTLLMCARADLNSFSAQCQGGTHDSCTSTSTSCPANFPLQYIEHSLTGYTASRGKAGPQTYEFDWTPPATNVGDVTVYVAGNAANGDLKETGDHIYTASFTLTPAGGGTPPAISANGVVNGASFVSGLVPGSWLTIVGTNLATQTDTWERFIVDGQLPTKLDGVSVNVGSKPAYVYFISPTQINVQAPDVGTGPVPVTVTNANGTSAPVTATVAAQSPAFFLWPGSQPVATRQDNSFAVKSGTFGSATVAAKPDDVLILWGTGFGPTTPVVAAGILVPADKQYNCSPVTVKIGTADAQFFGCALSPTFAGLYQVAIRVPASMPDGDYSLKATVGGTSSPDGVTLTVKK